MKKFKTAFFSIIFAYIYLMIALVTPIEFTVTAPYETKSTNDMILIEGANLTENLHSVSVMSINKITPFGRMLYELDKRVSVSESNKYISQLSLAEQARRGQIQKQASFEQSLITAYSLASSVNEDIYIDYDFLGIIVDYRENIYSSLKIGDIITEINGLTFTNYDEMINAFKANLSLDLKVTRYGQEVKVNLQKENNSVFAFYPKYQINQSSPKYSIPGTEVLVGGPSAGMMYTLSIYFSLINYQKINEIIVGTGTIRYNNEIGQIGGLEQKIYAALDRGAKYFILPKSQFQEVKHLANKINIYQVEDIYQAIEVIYEIFE